MTGKDPFAKLTKIDGKTAADVVRLGKLKFNAQIETPADAPVSHLIKELVAQNLLLDALKVLALALPGREAVWWGCLAVRDLMPEGKKTPHLQAAEAWVFKPTLAEKKKLRPLFEDPGGMDVAMCEAGFNVPMPDDEEPSVSPPHLVGLLVFTAQVKSHFSSKIPEEIGLRGELLLARGLDIAKGGSGQIDAKSTNSDKAIGEADLAG
ncbi:MAG: hypothetical protein WD046_08350 [Paracoccaceae bacterium]